MFRAALSVGLVMATLAWISHSIISTSESVDGPIPATSPAPGAAAARKGREPVTDRKTEPLGPSGPFSAGSWQVPVGSRQARAVITPLTTHPLRLRLIAHQMELTSGEESVVPDATPKLVRLADPSLDLISVEDTESRPAPELSPHQKARRARIRQCLDFYYHRRALNSKDDGPWSMMHAMLGFDVDTEVHVGGPGGKRTSMIGYLTANRPCRGERLLQIGKIGPYARRGPGLQGHDCQFLAMLAQCDVAADHPLRAGDREFTVADLIEVEKAGCRARAELTFQLLSLSHYLPSDATWQTPDGQAWSISRLIREEMAQPINGVTCGGTHRLMALAYAVKMRRAEGEPIDGRWARAAQFTGKYQRLALQLQNRDGSLSCDFFRKKGDWGGIERKLKTTGHTLEWLVYTLPERQLQSRQVLRAVDYLTTLMMRNRYYDWEKGPMGHGIRALVQYDQRVFGGQPGLREQQLAEYRNRPLPPAKVARRPSKSARDSSSKRGGRGGARSRYFGRSRRLAPR